MRTASAAKLRAVLRECSRQGKTERFLEQLSPGYVAWLLFDWEIWARDDQLPPGKDFVTWLLLGGRGAGKTRAGAEWVKAIALANSQARIALIGETLGDARAVMVEGVSGLLSVHADHERPKFEPSKKQVTWKNGAVAQLFSAEDPESLRGPQHSNIWADDARERRLYRLFAHYVLRPQRHPQNRRAGARAQRGMERYLRVGTMTGNDLREVLKWSLVLAAAVALWCGVLAVRDARGAGSEEPHVKPVEKQREAAEELRPVWVIVVYEMRSGKLVGITEFVFPTYQACQEGAMHAKAKLGLALRPVCYLRWMKTGLENGA